KRTRKTRRRTRRTCSTPPPSLTHQPIRLPAPSSEEGTVTRTINSLGQGKSHSLGKGEGFRSAPLERRHRPNEGWWLRGDGAHLIPISNVFVSGCCWCWCWCCLSEHHATVGR
ncbi:unnamed protein product, partial [Ectocarpus fasciculatus]